jgi:segregation and condensation protein B
MDATEIKYFVEAALLAAGRPLNVAQLQSLFDGRIVLEKSEIRQAIGELNEEYEPRGIVITEVASGFRVQVKAGMADQLQKLWEERPPRYSRALFETLALVAYRQPITRGEIEDVRGVSVSPNIIRTLLEREWVRVVGHRDVPGRPEMFGTTKTFLDYFGLKRLEDLPPLADLADWESLRIQLDLPEVEHSGEAEGAPVTDLPVLYPEIREDDEEGVADEAIESEPVAAEEPPDEPGESVEELPELQPLDEEPPLAENEDEDDLIVSEWPDPAKSEG